MSIDDAASLRAGGDHPLTATSTQGNRRWSRQVASDAVVFLDVLAILDEEGAAEPVPAAPPVFGSGL